MIKRLKFWLFLALYFAALSASGPAISHHGVNGQFDQSKTIEITGAVTNIRFVNPHAYVYFEATDETGAVNEWRCELGSGSLLKRKGWTNAMFADGAEITILGAPARNETLGCFVRSITFADGTTIERNATIDADGNNVKQPREPTLADGTPNIGGNWVAPPRERGGFPPGPPPNGERLPGPPPGSGGRPDFKLTEVGEGASEGYTRDDNPRFNCAATNIFDDWTFDEMVNKIVQTEDDIIIYYGFMDIIRTIHLDLSAHPTGIQPSRAGHSIGKWEGDVLVVDTVGFDSGYIKAPPVANGAVKNSEQLHIIERFSLSEDGKTLLREYEGEDPLYLVRKFSGKDSVMLTDAGYSPYDCDDLTNKDAGRLIVASDQQQTDKPEFLVWLENTVPGLWVSSSPWGYPIMLSLHAIGMGALVGIAFMLSFRVMGFASAVPVTPLLFYWRIALAGFVVNLLSGAALFSSSAVTLWGNWTFLIKIILVFIGLSLTGYLVKTSARSSENVTRKHKVIAIATVAVWLAALIAGRLIGYQD